MAATSGSIRDKLPLALRVGVTGHRNLKDEAPLAEAIDACLAVAQEELAKFASTPAAKRIYRASGAAVPFTLRVISPLADGADRLVAKAGHRMGAELYFPLPFSRSEYEKDFSAMSAEDFRALLREGRCFELDGDRRTQDAEDQSYEAVGRFVIGLSDFLIAIWDGEPARGPGGTAEIVCFALRAGAPVWWIDKDAKRPPHWLRHATDLINPDDAPSGDEAFATARQWIAAALANPQAARREPARAFESVGWLAPGA